MEANDKRRRVARIGCDRLPPELLNMTMSFADGTRMAVETFDASTMGLGLIVPRPIDEVRGEVGVLLEHEPSEFKLIGEVVFSMPQGPKACRVGVQFTQTIAIETFLSLLPES